MSKAPKMGFEPRKRIYQNFKNVRVDAEVGGKQCKFRSKLEHKVAIYLELLKVSGHIKDWAFEQTKFIFPDDKYLVDFDVINTDGTFYYVEAKGRFDGRARRKLQLLSKYRPEVVIDMVFSGKTDALKMKTSMKYCRRVCVLRSRGGIYDLEDVKSY